MYAEIQYPDEFTNRLQALWGDGFLSPGGAEEVNDIVAGLDLCGAVVLDIGFGMGGPAISLVEHQRVRKVIGIDVEPQLLAKARSNADRAGVTDKIEFKIVEPGELQFEDESFDLVFSKDSLVHVENKLALYSEIFRVLKGGGVFAASDWLCGGASESKPSLNKFRELAHLEFAMATAREIEEILTQTGFKNVTTKARNIWFGKLVSEEIRQIKGPLYEHLIEMSGEQAITHWLDIKKAQLAAAQSGGLQPTHLRGFKRD